MTVEYHIYTIGLSALQKALEEMPIQAIRAARRANRKAADYARSQWAKRVSSQSGITQTRLKQHRALVFRTGRPEPHGVGIFKFWAGCNDLKTGSTGLPLHRTPDGAAAGRYQFPGGFIAEFRSGHRGIFKRAAGVYTQSGSGRRERLIEQSVPLSWAESIADDVSSATNDRLTTLLDQELRYEKLKMEKG